MTYYLGIDPGLSGALAFFDPESDVLAIFDMPTHDVEVGGRKKRTIDMHGLAGIVRGYAQHFKTVLAIIEKVHAMPKQGVTSSFNFGFNAGCAQMAVVAHQIPLRMVTPNTWKRSMKISADKSEARRQASLVFPRHAAKSWPLKKHDGRAEAALLARYLWESQPLEKRNTVEDLI